jgi:FkbM family methyltransferase
MTTKYFILSKNQSKLITDNEEDQIIKITSNHLIFVLPETNLPYYATNGLFENGMIEWAKQFCDKNKITLDIGAHTGTYGLSLADYSKEVYCFEPQRMTYYALCGSVALSKKENIICLQIGLGSLEQVGETTLKIRSNDGGGSSFFQIEGDPILREETISVRTLDSYELQNIGIIKMDVEFNELNVLKGAIKTLQNSNYPKIIFESNDENNELFLFIHTELKYMKIIKISNNMFLATN